MHAKGCSQGGGVRIAGFSVGRFLEIPFSFMSLAFHVPFTAQGATRRTSGPVSTAQCIGKQLIALHREGTIAAKIGIIENVGRSSVWNLQFVR